MHKNRVSVSPLPCLSPSQLVELCASKAEWCERRWDCHGIQASHKLRVCFWSLDKAREYLPVRDRSHADKIPQACKSLEIICTQATSGKELVKMPEEETPTGSSKQNTAGFGTGQSCGRGREGTGHGVAFQHHW